MCVIIWKKANKYISGQRLREAHRANPDGCGIMWTAMNKICHVKGVWDFDAFLRGFNECYRQFGDRDYIIHFRTASASAIGDEYCHPFFVNENLAFMQNGNLYEYSDYFPGRKQDGKSDVQRFNNECLQKLPPNFLNTLFLRNQLVQYNRECMSKMIFLDSQGNIEIINESAGEWIDGIWYSNGGIDNYVGYGYSGAYYYNEGDIRHKGGLMSVQMLPEDKRKSWNQCPTCMGWFKNLEGNCSGCETYLELMSYV